MIDLLAEASKTYGPVNGTKQRSNCKVSLHPNKAVAAKHSL